MIEIDRLIEKVYKREREREIYKGGEREKNTSCKMLFNSSTYLTLLTITLSLYICSIYYCILPILRYIISMIIWRIKTTKQKIT